MRACVWVLPAILGLGAVGCGVSTDPDPSATLRAEPAAARIAGPLDGGVPVAPAGRVGAASTLTAFPPTALLRAGATTYATGVGWIGAYRGSGLLLSSTTGALEGTVGTDGQLSDAVPDGHGGAYLAGQFAVAGGRRRSGVVRVGPDGTPDRRFVARGLRFVDALALGGGRLYAGGVLDGGDDRRGRGVVALDPVTGRVLRGFRAPARGRVSELELRDGRLYTGGALAEPRYVPDGEGGLRRRAPRAVPLPVAALDPRTGSRLATFRAPRVSDALLGQVTALRVVGGRLWVGTGRLGDRDGGSLRLLDPATGATRATPAFRGVALEVVPDGSRALVAGSLARRGGGRDLVRALDARTGRTLRGFAVPGHGPQETATDAVVRGGTLLVAGAGRTPPGPALAGVAVVDRGPVLDSGFVVAARKRDGRSAAGVRAPVPDGPVHALAALRRRVLAGGAFAAVDVRPTDLAAFDAVTGLPSPAPVPAVPGAMDVTAAGGLVWTTDGIRLVGFDPATGRVRHVVGLPYRRRDGDGPDAVRLTAAGGRVFVFAGSHGAPAGGDRGIVAYDAVTAERVPFRLPLPSARNAASPALLGVGDVLYAAGSFERRRPSGQQANLAVLKLDARTGALDDAFDPHLDGPVAAIGTTGPGAPLHVAGSFRASTARGSRPGALVALDPATGARDPSFAPVALRADPGAPLGVAGDLVVVRAFEGSLLGTAYDRAGRRLPVRVPGARSVSATDGAGLLAYGASGLLGPDTPAAYGLVRRSAP